MLETVSSLLNQGLSAIVPIVILLGLLVFVHELGHFLAAKYFGVRVETFSLGFGPKLIKFVKGDTTYCVSALPLGGYVKMFGDDPGKVVPGEIVEGSFLHKPVFPRIVIVLAGPLMNLVFAAVLFYGVANVGDKAVAPKVGEIAENSHAHSVGFRSFDQVNSINGENVKTWDDVRKKIRTSGDTPLKFTLQRGAETIQVSTAPSFAKNKDVLSSESHVGEIKGLTNDVHLPFIGLDPDSPLLAYGLLNGDHIVKINGDEISYFYQISEKLMVWKSRGETADLAIEIRRYENFTSRDPKFTEVALLVPVSVMASPLGIYIPETMVAEVKEDSPAAKAGVKKFDRLLAIDDQKIVSFKDIIAAVSSYEPSSQPLHIEILRGSEKKIFDIRPDMTQLEGRLGVKENRYTIGIVPLKNALPQTFTWKAKNLTEAFNHSVEQTWKWTTMTCLSFVRMIQGRVPAKNIGGFISIGQAAQQSWSVGISSFLKIMAIISINLFIINLFPVPILDGGQLVLFLLEAIKGSPLSLRKIEIAQQVGFIFILFLMAFAIFNDFSRIFGS